MNRVTILLEKEPTAERCEEIAHFISMEHFGADPTSFGIVRDLPEDTPLHLKDQFEAEIKGRKLETPAFLVIHGPNE